MANNDYGVSHVLQSETEVITKKQENLWFSDVFREVSKETSGTKWVKEVRNLMKNPEKPNPALKQKFSKNQLE